MVDMVEALKELEGMCNEAGEIFSAHVASEYRYGYSLIKDMVLWHALKRLGETEPAQVAPEFVPSTYYAEDNYTNDEPSVFQVKKRGVKKGTKRGPYKKTKKSKKPLAKAKL